MSCSRSGALGWLVTALGQLGWAAHRPVYSVGALLQQVTREWSRLRVTAVRIPRSFP
jgi:hypothetical protein